MDEAFDEFTPGKNKWVTGWNNGVPGHFGYSEIFDQWSVTDVSDLVRRDRNHPSIILWSIGNEVDYANDPFSDPALGEDYRPAKSAGQGFVEMRRAADCRREIFGSHAPRHGGAGEHQMSDAVNLPELLDAVGYNYQEARYAADHKTFPKRIIYGSENGHQYDAWLAVKTNSYISGQFLWTGIDYLGEAGEWPNRANGAGLLDLCGFKKPLGWFRQSLWSDKPMVYLCVSDSSGGGTQSRIRRRGKLELAGQFNRHRPLLRQLPGSHPDAERQNHRNEKTFRSRQRRFELAGSFRAGNAQSRWPRERTGCLRLHFENGGSGKPD